MEGLYFVAKPNPITTTLSKVSWWSYLGLLGVIAVVYRVLQWGQLPPGLSTAEANGGLTIEAITKGSHIGFHHETGYSPLWEILQSLSAHIFGPSAASLRVVAILIGLLAVVTTYAWANSWYDRRIAWVAAFLVAVLPWSVTLSRNALPTILALVTITSLLWALSYLLRSPSSIARLSIFALVFILVLAAGPWGWLSILIVTIAGLFQRKLIRRTFGSVMSNKLTYGAFALGLIIAVILTGYFSGLTLRTLSETFGLTAASGWVVAALRVGGMFFYHGDPDFHHNLGGEPMVNAFIGLAYVAGILLTLSRIQRARDRILLIVLALGLVPAIIAGGIAPNAARAALALPAVALLAAIGTFYLSDLWSTTFPINSAARSLGQTAISLLLVLTAFQCYTQYFVAWANSSETYIAYNRGATAASDFVRASSAEANMALIAGPGELPVANYLLMGKNITIVSPEELKALPTGKPRKMIITAEVHDAVVSTLQQRFPGGTLKAHLDRDGSELFYDYAIAK